MCRLPTPPRTWDLTTREPAHRHPGQHHTDPGARDPAPAAGDDAQRGVGVRRRSAGPEPAWRDGHRHRSAGPGRAELRADTPGAPRRGDARRPGGGHSALSMDTAAGVPAAGRGDRPARLRAHSHRARGHRAPAQRRATMDQRDRDRLSAVRAGQDRVRAGAGELPALPQQLPLHPRADAAVRAHVHPDGAHPRRARPRHRHALPADALRDHDRGGRQAAAPGDHRRARPGPGARNVPAPHGPPEGAYQRDGRAGHRRHPLRERHRLPGGAGHDARGRWRSHGRGA